jgi:hypothetical protein
LGIQACTAGKSPPPVGMAAVTGSPGAWDDAMTHPGDSVHKEGTGDLPGTGVLAGHLGRSHSDVRVIAAPRTHLYFLSQKEMPK